MMRTVFNILSSKAFKIVFGGMMIAVAATFVFLGDITILPFLAAGLGVFTILLALVNVNNLLFYVLTLFLSYVLASTYYEVLIKRYRLTITLPPNSVQFYFIASNKSLQWSDIFLTWLTPNEIIVTLDKKTTTFLKRGIPNNLRINHKDLYNKGYTLSIIKEVDRNYEYIVLLPIVEGTINLTKGSLGNMYYHKVKKLNYSLKEEAIKRKLDSLKNHGIY